MLSRSNRPLTQRDISIWGCLTLRQALISRKRLLQSTSNPARCVQQVQSTSNAARYLNLGLPHSEASFDISETTAPLFRGRLEQSFPRYQSMPRDQQAQIEATRCVRGQLDLLNTTRWVRGRLDQSFPRYQTLPQSEASSDSGNTLRCRL